MILDKESLFSSAISFLYPLPKLTGMIWLYAILSVLLVSLLSFIGLLVIVYTKKYDRLVLYLVSFAAGGMLGGALLHLLPEAAQEAGTITLEVSFIVLLGIVLSFLFENFLWNHYHTHGSAHKHKHAKPVAYLNLIGDGVHNFIDGLIIGAAYLANIPLGISTTLAVIMHEIPQEIGDFGILLHSGFSKMRALMYNFLSALSAVIGTIVALTLHASTNVTYYLIPFAAGNFIYISLTDLVPELHHIKQSKDWGKHLLLFLAGIGIMMLLLLKH